MGSCLEKSWGIQVTSLTRSFDNDNRQLTEVDATKLFNGAAKTDTYSYNADGSLKSVVTSNVATGQTRTYAYDWWDSAKQTENRVQTSGSSVVGWQDGISKLIYDNNGNLRSATDENARKTINYVTDMDGQILVRRELAARAGIDSDWALIDTSPGADPNGARQVVSGSQDGNQTRFFYYLNGHRIGDVDGLRREPGPHRPALQRPGLQEAGPCCLRQLRRELPAHQRRLPRHRADRLHGAAGRHPERDCRQGLGRRADVVPDRRRQRPVGRREAV